MNKDISVPAPAAQIHRDKMTLTITNICPDFKKKSEQEARKEIEARLYQIFKKYV